jgi:hypothetical protein
MPTSTMRHQRNESTATIQIKPFKAGFNVHFVINK